MNVGKRIRERRKEIGMPVMDLAEILNVDRATIYRYENGLISKLPVERLSEIAAALHTTPEYLMGWNEEIEKNPAKAAERHFEMIVDEDLGELFEDFKKLDATKKKIVKDLAHALAEEEV